MAAIVRALERALDAVAVVLFLAMFAAICAQVTLRYVFNAPLVWSDEFAQYCFVWVAFIGVVLAARNRSHIAITAIIERLPAIVALALGLLWQAGTLFACAVLVWYGILLAWQNRDVQMTSIEMGYWLVYAVVPIAGAFVAGYALRDAAALILRHREARNA